MPEKIKARFATGIEVSVPVENLIEDYQTLVHSLADESLSRELIGCVMDNLSTYIGNLSVAAALDIGFKPSGTTPVLMGCFKGFLMAPDGKDLVCAKGKPVSSLPCENCKGCEHAKNDGCDPEMCHIRMGADLFYRADSMSNESIFEIVGDCNCPLCGARLILDECKTGKHWDNDGNHILHYVCPQCEGTFEKYDISERTGEGGCSYDSME